MSDAPLDWTRIRAIFDAAAALDPPARRSYVARACGTDPLIRQMVDALLRSHEGAETFLETPAALLLEPDGPPAIGGTAGPYRLEALIGTGGMGEVYRAHDTRLDRSVAVKLLSHRVAVDAVRIRRFHAEARAASSLNHPNILVIHDFGDLDGRPFIVSELVDGETLRQRLDRGSLPAPEAVAVATQIAGALAAAHARGIVHRDVKPENLILRPDGFVKVLDFGVAKLLDAPLLDDTAGTQSGTLLGTPHYMSPEQAEGRDVDARSDLFSLGVVLYEMLAGRRPFGGDTPLAVLSSILRDAPPVAAIDPPLPRDLALIVERCLAKDRAGRFGSASELRAALEGLDGSPRASAREPSIESLAVLPFANATPEAEGDYLSDGIAETLINRLSQIPSLRVVPRGTAFRYRGRDDDAIDVGRQLQVQALLTGRVQQRGDMLTVQAELVDVRGNTQLWGDRFVRRVSDLLDVEDEIARQIADALRLTLSGEERARLAYRQTASTEAYDLCLKGRYYWGKRTPPDLKKSIGFFEQAIATDPGYALAYACLADSYVVMSVFDVGAPVDLLRRAKVAALRADDIEPDLPEAHAELCLIRGCLDRNWEAAAEACRLAVSRQPGYWLAHDHYAMTLAALGRTDEAVAEVLKGQALEPLSPVVQHHVAWVNLLARRYDESIAHCQAAIDLDATFPMAYMWMGACLGQQGHHDEAVSALEQAAKLTRGASIAVGALAHALAIAGRGDEARSRLSELRHPAPGRYIQGYGAALACVGLGEMDEAFEWLDRACHDHSFWLTYFAGADPRLDPVRGDARFEAIRRRLGLAVA